MRRRRVTPTSRSQPGIFSQMTTGETALKRGAPRVDQLEGANDRVQGRHLAARRSECGGCTARPRFDGRATFLGLACITAVITLAN
jgi:hypothetical protein